jgi:lipooligosaccharide transport system permease protein
VSLIQTFATSAVAIAERRRGKLGQAIYAGRPGRVLQRNFFALKSSTWMGVVSGFVEPVFYLLAFGLGIGQIIGNLSDGAGNPVSYSQYIAPALLATSAMNGAIYDSTWNVFFKMHFAKLYQTMLHTSLGSLDVAIGEIGWALLRGTVYAIGFMVVVTPMGLVTSWHGLLAIPAATLIAFGFASVGMAVTSYLTSFQQMSWVNFFMLPMFMFSGTFFPISVYPEPIQYLVMAMPLWQGVEMIRGLTLGIIDAALFIHIGYFLLMTIGGMIFTTRRLTALFMR